ncbi:MAG TPA: CYTH and CHAD domain-containing protein [Pseudonocardia sp.]|jgi:CHAD domain-containing protein|nr:CYTH and CHAD domain-containing protein [Pseudonocardia sp.]
MGRAVDVVRETERKYEAEGSRRLPDPSDLLGLDAGSGAERFQLKAVYFDTPDLRLLRARVTLRRRVGGPDEGWHLKLPAGDESRDEHRLPLSAGRRTEPPAELAALVRVHSRGAALRPVAQLDTTRRRWMLTDAEGHELVEVVEDDVRAHTMGAETTALSWREIEVELAEYGRVELLDRIEEKLAGVGVRRSESKSKLGRLLADRLAPGPPPRAKSKPGSTKLKRGSAGAVVLGYVREQASQIRAQDPLVRRDAPDAVHQLRVAARRMRSALQAYGKVIERDATRALTDELKWIGGELGGARDAEVIEERLTELIGGLPGELVMGPVSALVTRTMSRRRSDGQAAAIAALDSDRYLALHDAIDALLEHPPLTAKATRSARRELPRQLGRAWRRLDTRMAAAEALEPGPQRDAALHETRKAGKRLRYAAEIAQPAVGRPAKRLKRRAKTLHKELGDHQDAVVAKAVIRDLAVQAHLDGGNGFTFGVLHGLESERADRAERSLPDTWKKLSGRAVRKWLHVRSVR